MWLSEFRKFLAKKRSKSLFSLHTSAIVRQVVLYRNNVEFEKKFQILLSIRAAEELTLAGHSVTMYMMHMFDLNPPPLPIDERIRGRHFAHCFWNSIGNIDVLCTNVSYACQWIYWNEWDKVPGRSGVLCLQCESFIIIIKMIFLYFRTFPYGMPSFVLWWWDGANCTNLASVRISDV